MEAGDYNTNSLLISNLASVAYRIYEPVATTSTTFKFKVSDVVDTLRSEGRLVHSDAVRQGIWCFYLLKEDGETASHEQNGLDATLEVCDYQIQMVAEGAFEPSSVLKSGAQGTNTANSPVSSLSTGPGVDAACRGAPSMSLGPASEGFSAETKGSLDAGEPPDLKGYNSVSVLEVYSFFIRAVLSSLSTSFCRQTGAIPLNLQTFLLPPETFRSACNEVGQPYLTSLASFRVYLTTAGTLVISVYVAMVSGLVSSTQSLRFSRMPVGTHLLVAPMGALASYQGLTDGESCRGEPALGVLPEIHSNRPRMTCADRFGQYKSLCSRILHVRGLSSAALEGCSWLNVCFFPRQPLQTRPDGSNTHPAGQGPTVPWPASLCFCKYRLDDVLDTRYGNALPAGIHSAALDPSEFAQTWLHGENDRQAIVLQRDKARMAASDVHEGAVDEVRGQQASGSSPLDLYRLGSAAASGTATATASAVYPTPPDGMPLHGPTPSVDGTLSSPGKVANAALPQEFNHVVRTGGPSVLSVGLGEGLESAGGVGGGDAKRDQPGLGGFPESENMFGDLGEDVFEGNELTDADFNFFDENPGDLDLDLASLPRVDAALEKPRMMPETAFGSSVAPAPFDLACRGVPPSVGSSSSPAAVKFEESLVRVCPPAFAVPEFKDVRSTLAQASRKQQTHADKPSAHATAPRIKRPLSPFNSFTVYKRIRAMAPKDYASNSPGRRVCLHDQSTSSFSLAGVDDKKYRENGKFAVSLEASTTRESWGRDSENPLIPGKKWERKRQSKREGTNMSNLSFFLSNMGARDWATGTVSDSDESSSSGGDDLSDTSHEPSSPARSTTTRRRLDEDATSPAGSFRDAETAFSESSMDMTRLSAELTRVLRAETVEISVPRYFSDPAPAPLHLSCSDDVFISVAQVLVGQAASGRLKIGRQSCDTLDDLAEERRGFGQAMRTTVQAVHKVLPKALMWADHCQLRLFLEIQDTPSTSRPSLALLASPQVEVRRFDLNLSLLPSALPFWETLGLGPARGPKHVTAVGVFPRWTGLDELVGAFLDRLGSAYESLKLGRLERAPTVEGLRAGLFPCEGSETSIPVLPMPNYGSNLTSCISALGEALCLLPCHNTNIVVFFFYRPDYPSSIVDCCSAFRQLFELYRQAMASKKRPVVNELVLQLVPFDLISSDRVCGLFSPSERNRLAFETYDRCLMMDEQEGPTPSPAITVLEPPTQQRPVDFKLTTTPSQNPLQEGSCMHVAYAQSVDERWLAVAWTDPRGGRQTTASYCLGRRGEQLSTSAAHVASEIWETTCELLEGVKVTWNVFITKCGPMDRAEVDCWLRLARKRQPRPPLALKVVLVTVDTQPSLQLIPPAPVVPQNVLTTMYTTPDSTPQPTAPSPDASTPTSTAGATTSNTMPGPISAASTPNPTPGANAVPTTPGGASTEPAPIDPQVEPDASILDYVDAVWGATISHRLNNSYSLTDLNPALASGYLVKRGGPEVQDPPVTLEVNIVHRRDVGLRVHAEEVLRDLLAQLRGLATLARVRRLTEGDADVRPWHVAAVEKGVAALYQLM